MCPAAHRQDDRKCQNTGHRQEFITQSSESQGIGRPGYQGRFPPRRRVSRRGIAFQDDPRSAILQRTRSVGDAQMEPEEQAEATQREKREEERKSTHRIQRQTRRCPNLKPDLSKQGSPTIKRPMAESASFSEINRNFYWISPDLCGSFRARKVVVVAQW